MYQPQNKILLFLESKGTPKTDYRTIEIFAAWKRFTPKDGVNLFQAAEIFFGCRNGDSVPIPV
jgi:hypothetical protein